MKKGVKLEAHFGVAGKPAIHIPDTSTEVISESVLFLTNRQNIATKHDLRQRVTSPVNGSRG